jgi:hypothetical protein
MAVCSALKVSGFENAGCSALSGWGSVFKWWTFSFGELLPQNAEKELTIFDELKQRRLFLVLSLISYQLHDVSNRRLCLRLSSVSQQILAINREVEYTVSKNLAGKEKKSVNKNKKTNLNKLVSGIVKKNCPTLAFNEVEDDNTMPGESEFKTLRGIHAHRRFVVGRTKAKPPRNELLCKVFDSLLYLNFIE